MAVGFLKFFFFFFDKGRVIYYQVGEDWGRRVSGTFSSHQKFYDPPPPPPTHTHTSGLTRYFSTPPPPFQIGDEKVDDPPPPNTHTHTHLLAATYTHMPFYTPVFDGSYYVVPSVLGTNINHHQTMCKERRTDTSLTFLRSYGPLKIFL